MSFPVGNRDFFQANMYGEFGRNLLDMFLNSPLTAAEKKKHTAWFSSRYPVMVKEYPWEVEVFIPYPWFNRQYGLATESLASKIKNWNYGGAQQSWSVNETISDQKATFENDLLPVRTLLNMVSPTGVTYHPRWFHSERAQEQNQNKILRGGKLNPLRWETGGQTERLGKPPSAVFSGIALTPWEFGLAGDSPYHRAHFTRQRVSTVEDPYAGFTFFWMFPSKKTAEAYKRKIDGLPGRKSAKPKARVHKISSAPYGNTDIGFSRRAHLPPDNLDRWLKKETKTMPRKKHTRKSTMPTKKKLTMIEVNREAKKYHKSRAKKRWWTLLKKVGMKNARMVVHASHKLDADAQYSTKVPKSGKKKVPEHMTKTARKKAEGIYVFPKRKSYPIGDLFHARMAVLRSQWPSNLKNAGKVLRTVVRRWPQYNWSTYWNKEAKEAKNKRSIKTYAKTIKQR